MSAAAALASAATAAAPQAINARVSTYESILGMASSIPGARAAQAYATSAASSAATYVSDPSTSNYMLNVLLYMFLYLFILFLILLIVHYTFTPVFQFTPGSSGLIPISTIADDKIYWTDKKQPPAESRVPLDSDAIAQAPFDKDFTVSVDLYLRRPIDSASNRRILFYKTYRYGSGTGVEGGVPTELGGAANPGVPAIFAPSSRTTTLSAPTTIPPQLLTDSMATKCSMMAYLGGSTDGENDLYVVLYSGGGQYFTKPIKNVPTYKPFRLSVIVESTLFTVYINEKQVFQRIVPGGIALNSSVQPPSDAAKPQRFYSPPAWTDDPTKTIFLQNFHLWPRAISYTELKAAQPSLAAEADFDLPVESGSSSCS
jgi:hypothetical protein